MYFDDVHACIKEVAYSGEEGQLFYVDQQEDASTFNHLVNRARTETDSYDLVMLLH